MSAEQLFQSAIGSAGLPPPESIEADGKLHRFSSNGKRGDDSGWYVLHLDGVPGGSFGCWRAGLTSTWSAKPDTEMTQAERETQSQRIKQVQAQRDAEKATVQAAAATEASRRWDAAKAVTEHPYLSRREVPAYGLRIDSAGALLVPMRDAAGKLHSLQTINENGDKRFLSGGKVKACFHLIGTPKGVLIVCEGYATGASIHAATGHAVAVAFNAGNLEAVALALRAKYTAAKIIIAADDDHKTEGNPGITKATQAAESAGAMLAVPDFSGIYRPDVVTDFNDLQQICSADDVARCIEAAISASTDPRKKPIEAPDGVVLTCGSTLKPEPVSWLWRDWLAQGKLHLLAGAPGQGKTTIALSFMATVTSGGRWPDGASCPVGNVLMWTGEDDPADTLIPRLMAMGANIDRVFFVTGNRLNGEVQPFDPAKDMPQILVQAERIGNVRMLVLDPVVAVVLGDSHKNTEVRRAMQPLVDLGASLGAVVLGITHFSKGGAGSDPASRVIGSIAFAAVARVVLVAAKSATDDNESRRVLARSKSNIGPDDGGFEYHIDQAEPIRGIQASYIAWGGSVDGSARELLAEPEHDQGGGGGEAGAFDDACAFLRSELANGPKSAKYLLGEARQAGHSERTIKRAKAHLKVESRKETTGWLWGLTEDAEAKDARMPRGPRIPTLENLGTVGTLGTLEPESEVF